MLRFELIDLDSTAETAVAFRADSFACSFGSAERFYETDGHGHERYLVWLRRLMQSIPGSCVHAWDGGTIVGQIEMNRFKGEADLGYVNLYYLIPDYRNRGLGRYLDEYATKFLHSLGFPAARLSVSPTNQQALRFYTKNGWRDLGARADHPEVHLMEKRLVTSADESATSEEYLAAVTVGTREPLNGAVHLVPYDPIWASKFSLLADRVRDALAERVLLLEHVGSTSVPGLSAKPVVDIVLAVLDSANESSYAPLLAAKGFVLKIREPDWFEHRLFKSRDIDCNLHVFSLGCEEVDRMLMFRDWLRTHEEERRRYEDVKRELAAHHWSHVQNYADAKFQVVREILDRAIRTRGSTDD